ncbi:MAG TPA: alkyl sulfatase dimerization domain-containing protein [Myxococcota bacterium]|nr:alkyl sulfatase dimerization domain-containing protein [Myxococcota bacterium]
MTSFLEQSDALLRGEGSTAEPGSHPFHPAERLEEVAAGFGLYKGFVNVVAVRSADGVLLVDTGSFAPFQHQKSFEGVRRFAPERLHTAIYTHGHVDHAYGLPPFLAEAEGKGWAPPRIVGHRAVPIRMARYGETAGYNQIVNQRQFGIPMRWPTDPILPTDVYDDALTIDVGGVQAELHHARGETDDHTWIFFPRARVLCTGDLFIWCAPNAGNPQKVQRYAADWAVALRKMAALGAELLLPGHGLPIAGAARVKGVLEDTAAYLESLYRDTVALLNQGATIYEIVEAVKPPAHLAEKPFLRPVYDEPEFIVRNVVRHLGGWWSGVPSELKPAPRRAQAREIAALAGGVGPLLARAKAALLGGDLKIASHLADWAVEAEPESREAHALRAEVYTRRTLAESSTMSRGVFGAAARESRTKAEGG